MPYDVFISYSHQDRDWGLAVKTALERKQLSVFRDRDNIIAGQDWRNVLGEELEKSRKIVVLWSKHAKTSEFVPWEETTFEARHKGPQDIIVVLLDEEKHSLRANIHMITEIQEASVYGNGFADFQNKNPNLWSDILEKIYQAIVHSEPGIPVSLLILAATDGEMRTLDFTNPPGHLVSGARSLNDVLAGLQTNQASLMKCYGPERRNWKPLGSSKNIHTLLNEQRDHINSILNPLTFRWEPVTDLFWTGSVENRRTEIQKLAAPNPAVIVIDPISLYVPRIHTLLTKTTDCQDNARGIIMVLTPYAMPQINSTFKDVLQLIDDRLYEEYYNPGNRRFPCARLSVNFGDDLVIRRSLLHMWRAYTHSSTQTEPHQYIKAGGSR